MRQTPATMAFADSSEVPRFRQTIAVAVVLSAMALVVLDAAMVNVAVPTLADVLGVTPARGLRVVSVYQAALVMALLPCAALGEALGYRRVFVAGVTLFIAAALSSAAAPSFEWLIAARFLQGLGGAAIMALGVALLRQALPEHRVGAAIGWNALTVALSSAAGPALGATIMGLAGWKSLFLVHLPFGLLALAGSQCLPSVDGTGQRLDVKSSLLCSGAFAALMIGAESLATAPAIACALIVTSALCFKTLARREGSKQSPLIPVDLLRNRPFHTSVAASICCFAGQAAGLLALPFYLRHGLGQSPLMTGLCITAWPLAVAVSAMVAGRLSDRMEASLLCAIGGGLLGAGLITIALLPLNGNVMLLMALIIPCGFGFGLFQVPNNRILFLSAPLSRSAAAGGMQGTARLAGQTSGSILMTLLFIWAPAADAPQLGLAIGAVLALAAAAISATPILSRSRDSRLGSGNDRKC